MAKTTQARLKLSAIHIGEGTQQRDIDTETLVSYTELIGDGAEFPPIEVVHDGKTYHMWDGFHRYFAHRDAGKATILANIRSGTLRDAVWLSFSANKDHGLPRPRGAVKEIFAKILTDKEWAKISISEIARHVGANRQYLQEIKESILSVTRQDAPPVQRAEKVKVQRGDQEYEMTVPKTRDPEPLLDSAGNPVPKHLAEIFLARAYFRQQADLIREMQNEVMHRIEDQPKLMGLFNVQRFNEHTRNLIEVFKFATPYAVCPYCGGDSANCKACKGIGYMSKSAYEAAPKEYKK